MNIEAINENQVKRIQEIAYQTWPDTFKNILSQEQIEYMLNWMYNQEILTEQIRNGHRFFILNENEKDLGFIGVQPNYPNVGISKIHKIYVLPNTQGKGVGKKLIEFIEVFLKENFQSGKVFLNVNRFNRAVDFYHKIGFNIVKEENIDIGNGFLMEDYVMEKVLN